MSSLQRCLARAILLAGSLTTVLMPFSTCHAQEVPQDLFAPSNLVAWCIVPFDCATPHTHRVRTHAQAAGVHQAGV